jgi:hypothetical protein
MSGQSVLLTVLRLLSLILTECLSQSICHLPADSLRELAPYPWGACRATMTLVQSNDMTADCIFTDKELDAIYEAMRDYADYGDEQAEIADSILSKIALL